MSNNGRNEFNTNTEDTAREIRDTARTTANGAKRVLSPVVKLAKNAIGKAAKAFFATFGKYIAIILAVIIVVALIIASIWCIVKVANFDGVTKSTSKVIRLTKSGLTGEQIVEKALEESENDDKLDVVEDADFSSVATIEGTDESGYYINISSTVLDNIIKVLEESGVEPESIGLESFDCFRTFIEAEIITQFPNLGNTNLNNNSKDIIANGCINIKRTGSQNNSETTLSYTNLNKFNEMVENNNRDVLKYFSLNENGELLIASYSSTKRTVETDGDATIVQDMPQGEDTYSINVSNINYKNIVNKYSMPFSFLVAVLEGSNSEDLAIKLAELAKNTEITITIEDNLQVIDSTDSYIYNRKLDGNKKFKYTITKIDQYTNNAYSTKLVDNKDANVKSSPDEKECKVNITTHTERNTPNIELTYVDSWIAKAQKEYTCTPEETPSSYEPIEYEDRVQANIEDFDINTDVDVANFMNKEINYYTEKMEETPEPSADNFVSRYITSSKSNLDVSDLEVIYNVTNTSNSISKTNKYTSEKKQTVSNENKIFELFDQDEYGFGVLYDSQELLYKLLESNPATANYSDIMRYLINKYKDPNYQGELDLSGFELNDFYTFNNYIYGNTPEEKVWFALRDAGYSEEAVAGVMGNIYAESGFDPTIIEKGTGIGLGLCQWSFGRRNQLELYMAAKGVDSSDIDTQIEFLLTEITPGGEGPAQGFANYQLTSYNGYNGNMWENADNPKEAAIAFCWSFERPGEPRLNVRVQKAEEYYQEFKGRTKPAGGAIIQIADEIHRYMQDQKYTYCVYGTNKYEECKNYGKTHGLNKTFEQSKTGYQNTCCATYVSWVLQEAGYLEESEHTDGATNLMKLLKNKGWVQISNVSQLEPGDVIYYGYGHIEIFAGDGKVYNAGSGNAIRGSSPATNSINSMSFGLRAPY